jgi:hypothetical protein
MQNKNLYIDIYLLHGHTNIFKLYLFNKKNKFYEKIERSILKPIKSTKPIESKSKIDFYNLIKSKIDTYAHFDIKCTF